MLVAQLCLTLWDPMDCSPPGSSVHGLFQARILEWVAIPFSRGSSQSRDRTWVYLHCRQFFTVRATIGSNEPRLSSAIYYIKWYLVGWMEKETATHSSILAWRIPWTGEPGGLLSMGLHRVGHDWSDLAAAAAAGGGWKVWAAGDMESSVFSPYQSTFYGFRLFR